MTISFSKIPIDVRVPGQYVEFDNSKAMRGLPAIWHRILVIGQKLPSGSQDALTPFLVSSADQGVVAAGQGSMFAAMIRALKAANSYTECWGVLLDDNLAGAAASGAITLAGTATAAGTLPPFIAGTAVQVGVSVNQTAAAAAIALAAAINANTDLPVTAAVDGTNPTKVNLTARNKGECGNAIDIRIGYYPSDVVPSGLTATVTPMSGGAGNPSLTALIAAISDDQYQTIVLPYTDAASTAVVAAELERRFGPMVMKEGRAYAAANGTVGQLAALGSALNTPHLTIMGCQKSPTPPYVWAAVVAGITAYYGNIDPARPLQTLALPGVLPPAVKDRFTSDDRNLLLHDGISTFLVDPGGAVMIERAITCFRVNAFGLPDISYLDVETMLTLFYLRYSVRVRISSRFPRHKLGNDGGRYGAGQAIVTPSMVRDELVALFGQWEEAGLVEDLEQFKNDLLVERDGSDPNRLNALIPPNLVNQFRVFAGLIQFLL